MNKSVIFYYSKHHYNTKKIVIKLAEMYQDISIISLTSYTLPDLSEYELFGFASGVYIGKPKKKYLQY
jgi:hypothetical protein